MQKRKGYAKGDIESFSEMVEKKIRKWTRTQQEKIGWLIEQKLRRIQKNVQKDHVHCWKVWLYC